MRRRNRTITSCHLHPAALAHAMSGKEGCASHHARAALSSTNLRTASVTVADPLHQTRRDRSSAAPALGRRFCVRTVRSSEGGQLLPGSVTRHYRRGHLVLPGVLPGVTWSVTWCYLVLPGVLPGVTWVFILESFFFVVPKYPRFSNSNFWKKSFST